VASSSSRWREELSAAQAGWLAGRWRPARDAAKRILAEVSAAGQPQLHAQACLLVAQALSLESQYALAARFAARARQLFAQQQDAGGQAESVLLVSAIESALGHDREAVEAAELATAGVHGLQRRAAAGLNYRGVAALWRNDYATARGVLDTACGLAPEEAGRSASAFHPLVNAIFAEALRNADLRMQGQPAQLAELEMLVAHAWALVKTGDTRCLVDISPTPGLFLLSFATCFLASRSGEADRADRYYLKCLEHAAGLPQASWMHALVWWARLERTTAAREVQEAGVSAQRMLVVALDSEHVPLKSLARRLGADAQNYLGAAASPYATFM
jgi:hypothetical protein